MNLTLRNRETGLHLADTGYAGEHRPFGDHVTYVWDDISHQTIYRTLDGAIIQAQLCVTNGSTGLCHLCLSRLQGVQTLTQQIAADDSFVGQLLVALRLQPGIFAVGESRLQIRLRMYQGIDCRAIINHKEHVALLHALTIFHPDDIQRSCASGHDRHIAFTADSGTPCHRSGHILTSQR